MFRRVRPVLLSLLLVACPRGSQVRPTPPPPFAGKPIDSVSTSQIIAYANTLQFDSTAPDADTTTVHTPMGDTIHLAAAPDIGTLALSDTAVAQGRILGRIESSAAFAPLGVAKGTNYFWVSGAGDRAQVVIIPADSSAPRVTRPLVVGHHTLHANYSTARFVTIGSDGIVIFIINFRCSDVCCNLASDYPASLQPQVDSALDAMHQKIGGGT
jgi:hypothetical protein